MVQRQTKLIVCHTLHKHEYRAATTQELLLCLEAITLNLVNHALLKLF